MYLEECLMGDSAQPDQAVLGPCEYVHCPCIFVQASCSIGGPPAVFLFARAPAGSVSWPSCSSSGLQKFRRQRTAAGHVWFARPCTRSPIPSETTKAINRGDPPFEVTPSRGL